MRPIRLTLQAFGPFAGKEVINFEQTFDVGLFGIYGPTGAGKTSIFDGLCFALFGQSSGAQRDGKDFRSDHAPLDMLTEVELVFDLGDKRYVVRRIPAQERLAKKGGKTTQQLHQAWLFDASGLNTQDITDANRGKAIAEKKTSVVEQTISELLGYSADQFRQIILLPQGQFRKVLDANTKDRSQILRQLFDVSLYEKLQDKLKEEAKTLHEKVNTARIRRDDRLMQSGHETFEALELAIKEAHEQVKKSQAALDAAKKNHSAKRDTLEKAKANDARFVELEKAKADLIILQANQSDIDARKADLEKVRRAESLLGLEAGLSRAKLDHKEASQRRIEAKVSLEKAEKAHASAKVKLTNIQKQSPEIEALSETQNQLNALLDIQKSTISLATDLKTKTDQRKTSHAQANAAKQEQAALKTQLKELSTSAKNAIERGKKIANIEKEIERLNTEIAANSVYENTQKQTQNLEAKFKSSQANHLASKAKLENAQTELDVAEKALANVQALHLASKLKHGDNCPVCGSRDHPKLAKGDASSQGLDPAFRAAEKTYKIASEDERKANDALIADRANYNSSLELFSKLEKPKTESDALKSALHDHTIELKKLNDLPTLEAINQKISLIEREEIEVSKRLETILVEHEKNQLAHNTAQSRYDDAIAKIPTDYQTTGKLEKALETNKNKIDGFKKELENVVSSERETASVLSNAQTSLKDKHETENRALKRVNSETANFETALIEAKLDEASFQAAKLLFPKRDAISKAVENHSAALISVKTRIEQAKLATQNVKREDLTRLQHQVSTAETEVDHASNILNTVNQQQLHLKATLESVQKATQELDKLNAEYAPLGEMSDLTNGTNPYKLKLVDFAIAAMYDDVLDAANQRLGPMTDSRFELRREAGGQGGNASRGLDTLIFDAHTESLRATSSLSGGEGFLASLALALGLSDVVQQQSGGVRLDAIFIDEGFGSLDSAALDLALQTLHTLADNNRLVGIISHVEEVKRTIPNGFSIEPSTAGSHIKLRTSTY